MLCYARLLFAAGLIVAGLASLPAPALTLGRVGPHVIDVKPPRKIKVHPEGSHPHGLAPAVIQVWRSPKPDAVTTESPGHLGSPLSPQPILRAPPPRLDIDPETWKVLNRHRRTSPKGSSTPSLDDLARRHLERERDRER